MQGIPTRHGLICLLLATAAANATASSASATVSCGRPMRTRRRIWRRSALSMPFQVAANSSSTTGAFAILDCLALGAFVRSLPVVAVRAIGAGCLSGPDPLLHRIRRLGEGACGGCQNPRSGGSSGQQGLPARQIKKLRHHLTLQFRSAAPRQVGPHERFRNSRYTCRYCLPARPGCHFLSAAADAGADRGR